MREKSQPPQENKMGDMPINRLLLSMSGPMMISMLIQALYNVVDSMFVSYISESALTAVSLAYPMQNLMVAVATGTGVGINALLSRNLGEKNFPIVNRTAGNAIFLGLISYVVFALVGLFGSRIYFTVQVSDPEIIQMGQDYLSVILILSIGCFGQVLLSRLLQSTGKTFYSMVIQMVGAVLNIILDPIMIFGLLGFPAMGVAGAALATVISQVVGTLMGLYYNLRKNPEIQFSLNQLRPSAPIIARIYSVGVPSILLQTVSSLLIFGLNQILVAFSETATAVYGVYFKLQGFAFLPIIGMNNGMVPIIAYNYGAKKPERILQTIKLAITYALIIMVAAVAVFQIFPTQLLGFFQASPEMLEIGVPALRILSLCFIIGGFTIVSSSVFQALGRGLLSMSISIFRQLVLVLPLAYFFSLTGKLEMVWWAFPVAEVLAGLLALYYLRRAYRRVILPLGDHDYQY
ncbi:MAG: MATE family efflux transporter [Clostridiales bacterium]|nr:MATE family efflux transporter [Clostridiales bacterium]